MVEDRDLSARLEKDLGAIGHLVASAPPPQKKTGARPAVDLALVQRDGLEDPALRELRNLRIPLVALVPEGRLGDLAGADDFIMLPYRRAELEARLEFHLSRRAARPQAIRCRDLLIDPDNFEVLVADAPLELTYKEYELLRFLASHPRRVFSRDDLLSRVWGYEYYGGTRTVDVHIRRLRAKLGHCAPLIETVRNVGYRFSAEGA